MMTAKDLAFLLGLSVASLGVGFALGAASASRYATPSSSPSSSSTSAPSEPASKTDGAGPSVPSSAPASSPPKEGDRKKDEGDDDDDEDDEDEEEEEARLADGDLAAITAAPLEPCKMVLVVRTDLGMTPGKIAAQCGHATLACYKALSTRNPRLLRHWERTGQAKIALKCNSEDQLLELEAVARSLNLCARSIVDAGRTQIAAGSRTVLAIGPAPVGLVNQVTAHLRLL